MFRPSYESKCAVELFCASSETIATYCYITLYNCIFEGHLLA